MNKKLLALAVAAALAPTVVMAEPGTVTAYGNVHLSMDYLDGSPTGANSADRLLSNDSAMNVSSNSSYIGFKGTEKLGNGLNAIWQMESQVNMGGTGGSANALTSRNSFVGLNGGWGTALLGIHDTPMKIIGRKVELFGDQVGDSRNIISVGNGATTGFTNGESGVGWDLRPNNVMAYITPTFSGFHGALAYVTNVASESTGGAATSTSVDAFSGLVMWESGPWMAAGAYEVHNFSNASPLLEDSSAYRLVGGATFGDFRVTALYQDIRVINTATAIAQSGNRQSWGLGGAYKMGANTFKAQYYQAGNISGSAFNDTGADMFAIGWDYALSKRTTAYVAYAQTSNDTNALFNVAGAGHGDNPGTVIGQNPSGFSVGMQHKF